MTYSMHQKITFADDTNLFNSHRNISILFSDVNVELDELEQWVKANKLSLSIVKAKHTLFHKNSSYNDLQLKHPDLKIENVNKERNSLHKIFGSNT